MSKSAFTSGGTAVLRANIIKALLVPKAVLARLVNEELRQKEITYQDHTAEP